MNCVCGVEVSVEPGHVETCGSCGRQNISCKACGAGISADAAAIVLACPYCDSPIAHRDLSGMPMFFPVNLSAGEAKEQLLRFLLNRFGIPGDFERRFKVDRCEPVYVPLQLFTVTAQLTESITEVDSKAIIRTRAPWYRSELGDYRFAARVKQVMDPDQVTARTYDTDITVEQAEKQAQAFGKLLLRRDKARFSEVRGQQRIIAEDGGSVFYPLYEVSYRYGGRPHKGVVDAASGVVCKANHPVGMGARGALLGSAAAMMLFTLLVVAFFGLLGAVVDPSLFLSAVLSLGAGTAATIRIVWTALRSHSGREELNKSEHLIDLPDLDTVLDVDERKDLSGTSEHDPPPRQRAAQHAGG